MIRFEVDTSHPATGHPQQLPAAVTDFIARANAIIEERLEPLAHEHITADWHRLDDRDPAGWSADLRLELDGWSLGQRFHLARLDDRTELRRAVRELVSEFAALVSRHARDGMRRVHGEIRELIRHGGA